MGEQILGWIVTLLGGFLFNRLNLGTFLGDEITTLHEDVRYWWDRAKLEYLKIVVGPINFVLVALAFIDGGMILLARSLHDSSWPAFGMLSWICFAFTCIALLPLALYQRSARFVPRRNENGQEQQNATTGELLYHPNHPERFSLPLSLTAIVLAQSALTGLLVSAGAMEHKRIFAILGLVSLVIMVGGLAIVTKAFAWAIDVFVRLLKEGMEYIIPTIVAALPRLTAEQLEKKIEGIAVPRISPIVSAVLVTFLTSSGFLILDQILYPSLWLLRVESIAAIIMTGTSAIFFLHGGALRIRLAVWRYLCFRFAIVGFLAVFVAGWDYASPAFKTSVKEGLSGWWYARMTQLEAAHCYTPLTNWFALAIFTVIAILVLVYVIPTWIIPWLKHAIRTTCSIADSKRSWTGRITYSLVGLASFVVWINIALLCFAMGFYVVSSSLLLAQGKTGPVCWSIAGDTTLIPAHTTQNVLTPDVVGQIVASDLKKPEEKKEEKTTDEEKSVTVEVKETEESTRTESATESIKDPWDKTRPTVKQEKVRTVRKQTAEVTERAVSKPRRTASRRDSDLWDPEFVSLIEKK